MSQLIDLTTQQWQRHSERRLAELSARALAHVPDWGCGQRCWLCSVGYALDTNPQWCGLLVEDWSNRVDVDAFVREDPLRRAMRLSLRRQRQP